MKIGWSLVAERLVPKLPTEPIDWLETEFLEEVEFMEDSEMRRVLFAAS